MSDADFGELVNCEHQWRTILWGPTRVSYRQLPDAFENWKATGLVDLAGDLRDVSEGFDDATGEDSS